MGYGMTHLRRLRLRANVSQEMLGEAVGVAQTMVSQWENGLYIPEDRAKALIEFFKSRGIEMRGVGPEDLNKLIASC